MIKLNFYKNKVQGNKNFGKVYARAKNDDPIDIEGLAKHNRQSAGNILPILMEKGLVESAAI